MGDSCWRFEIAVVKLLLLFIYFFPCCEWLTGFLVCLLLGQVSHPFFEVRHLLHQGYQSTPDGEVTVTVYPPLLIQLYTWQKVAISAQWHTHNGGHAHECLLERAELNGTVPQCLIRSSWKSSSCSRMYSGQGHSCLSSLKLSSVLICRSKHCN